jgi:hypothetical protein
MRFWTSGFMLIVSLVVIRDGMTILSSDEALGSSNSFGFVCGSITGDLSKETKKC